MDSPNVADTESGLQVLSYLAFDNLGQAPTITIDASFALNHVNQTGQAEEGKAARVSATVTDDVQVRNVEYYMDGALALVDGNYPFEYRFVTPARSATKNSFTLRAKAMDTGGNATWSPLYTVALVPDIFPPVVQRVSPRTLGGSLKTVLALFNEPLNPATVTAAHFQLTFAGPDGVYGNADDTAVTPSLVSYRDDIQAASFEIANALPSGKYRGLLTTGLTDMAGNGLASSYTWDFTVDNSNVYWVPTNNGSFSWGNAANWSTGAVPSNNTNVVIDAGPGVRVDIGGQTLQGVSITVLGGASLFLGGNQSTTLYDVTLNSDLRLEGSSSITINGGLTLNNAKLILTATGGVGGGTTQQITFGENQTIGGTGEIILGDGGTVYAGGAGVTIAPGITVRARGTVYLTGNTETQRLINQGTILTDSPTTNLYLNYVSNQGTLDVPRGTAHFSDGSVNPGTMQVSDTGRLELGSTNPALPMTLADIGVITHIGGEVVVTGTVDLSGGTLALNATTGSWKMAGGTLQNGSITTAGGAELQVRGGVSIHSTLKNIDVQGTVSVVGTDLYSAPIMDGAWQNHGTIILTNATLILDGIFKLSDVGTITRTNSIVTIFGVIDNTGLTFRPNDLPADFTLNQGGTIKGGSISAAGSDPIIMPDGAGWTFDGVTLNRDMKAGYGCYLGIIHGLTLNNAKIIGDSLANPGFASLRMEFQGAQTLGGTGQIVYDDAALNESTLRMDVSPLYLGAAIESGHLTIGSGITVKTGISTLVQIIANAQLTNQGSLLFGRADGIASIDGQFTQAGTLSVSAGNVTILGGSEVNWTNTGTMNLSGIGSLHLGDTFTLTQLGTLNRTGGTVRIIGTLDLTPGGTLALNATTGSWELGSTGGGLGAGIKGGTITTAGGAVLAVPESTRGFLENVTLQGSLTVTTAQLFLLGDWVNNGTITATDSDIWLYGEFRQNELGTINRTGGIINIAGILDNTGTTYHLDSPIMSLSAVGTIKGGTVSMTGPPPFSLPDNSIPTFDAVTLACDLVVPSQLTLKNGFTFNGSKISLLEGHLSAEATQTLGGTGQIILDGATGPGITNVKSPLSVTPSILTIGAGVTIIGHDNASITAYGGGAVGDQIINQGIIRADTAGKKIDIYGPFTNQGQLQQLNGGTIVIH